MASSHFKLTGHSLTVFNYLQRHPNEWHNAIDMARAVGARPGTLGAAMRALQRANYAILEHRGDASKHNRTWIKAVETPGKPSCDRCGVTLPSEHDSVCKSCLPLDPALSHPDVQPGSPQKVDLLAQRYAAGLPLWPEPYTSPLPSTPFEERHYDDRDINPY